MPPMPDEKLKVLFATSEVAPLIKTGGLADVSAALPAAFMGLGADMRVLVPGYPQVMEALKTKGRAATLPALPGVPRARGAAGVPGANGPAPMLLGGVPLLVIEGRIPGGGGGPYQDAAGND